MLHGDCRVEVRRQVEGGYAFHVAELLDCPTDVDALASALTKLTDGEDRKVGLLGDEGQVRRRRVKHRRD